MWPILIMGAASSFFLFGCERRQRPVEGWAPEQRTSPYIPPTEQSPSTSQPTSEYRTGLSQSSMRNYEGMIYPSYMGLHHDLRGNPSLGTVLFLRQVHREMDSTFSEEALNSQWDLFRYLHEVARPRVVFWEGLSENYNRNRLNQWIRQNLSQQNINRLDELRSGPLPQNPDIELRELVAMLSASFVYGYVSQREDLLLHRVMTTDEENSINFIREDLSRCESVDSESERSNCQFLYEPVLMEGRERWATREISNFLRDHPGETVALIYGAAHTFCDNFRGPTAPNLISLWSWTSRCAGLITHCSNH